MLDRPAIDVRDIRKTYPGGVEAVQGIGFEVAAGEAFGLLGPNGAGKSTTIGMLTTTVAPTERQRARRRLRRHRRPLAARRASGIVFQDSAVDRALTGRRNLDIHARLWGVERARRPRRIAELADALGLAELLERAVATYSGGERRRLEIARALVSRPAGAVPGRADGRARPAHPPRAARGHRPPARSRRDDDPAHDALPRRGRAAVRPGRDHPRRADHRTRHARGSRRRSRRRARRGPGATATRPPRWPRCARTASPATTPSRSARR